MIAASRARLPLTSSLLGSLRHGSSFRSGPNPQPSIRRIVPDSLAKAAKVSLAEELFPERQNNGGDKEPLSEAVDEKDLFLPLPSLEELLADQKKASRPRIKTDAASQNAVKQENCAVLLLQSASTSLVENDFRLLCPKGKHIEGWTGLGDVEKVIPGRDPVTLERSSYYFLLFRNPAHALAYQANALRLYRHARAHTPSGISSPAAPSPGAKVPREFRHAVPVSRPPGHEHFPPSPPEDSLQQKEAEEEELEDAYTLFNDFALCAPAQRLNLTYIRPPFSPALLRLIARGGYLGDRSGRSVRLSIVAGGPKARAAQVRAAIARDGREWEARVEELSQVTSVKSVKSDGGDGGRGHSQGNPDESTPSPLPSAGEATPSGKGTGARTRTGGLQDTFIIILPDDSSAQRFFRAWNQRRVVFSSSSSRKGSENGAGLKTPEQQDDDVAVVRAEVLW